MYLMISSLINKKQPNLPNLRKEYNKANTRLTVKNTTKITLTQFEERLYEKVSFSCGDHHKKIILTQTEERLKIRKIPVSSGKHHKKIKLTQIEEKLTEKILFSCEKHHKKSN